MSETEANYQRGNFQWTEEKVLNELEKSDPKQSKINEFDKNNHTALMFAALYKGRLMKMIIRHPEVKPNLKRAGGLTGAMLSCQHKQINYMLPKTPDAMNHRDVDPNIQDNEGFDALIHAAMNDSPLLDRLLDQKQIIANQQDNHGKTASMWAVEKKNSISASKLTNSEKDIGMNKQDEDGNTLLMLAVQSSSPEITQLIPKMLERSETDLNIKNNNGETALDLLKKHNSDTYNFEELKSLFVEKMNKKTNEKVNNQPEQPNHKNRDSVATKVATQKQKIGGSSPNPRTP